MKFVVANKVLEKAFLRFLDTLKSFLKFIILRKFLVDNSKFLIYLVYFENHFPNERRRATIKPITWHVSG